MDAPASRWPLSLSDDIDQNDHGCLISLGLAVLHVFEIEGAGSADHPDGVTLKLAG